MATLVQPSGDQNDPLLERCKFFRDHVQTVLNLATGAFVLSVTFLDKRVTALQDKHWLVRSWWLLVVAMFFGLTYNYVLSIYLRNKGQRFGLLLNVANFVLHVSFFAGMYCLLQFGLRNL